ncbi:hypothetical protein C0995_002194 [Termitomyces sp. Mi166|nr:hypothetical protein C0995_002194 [Termitomyces sp. Mi166\
MSLPRDSNDPLEDIQESQSSQQQTQSTQPASQPPTDEDFDHMWGYLEPCSREVSRISFFLGTLRYKLGRRGQINDYVLNGMYISGVHCIITWNGTYQDASVTVLDKSLNGTFINGVKIEKGSTAVLRHGSEISFNPPWTKLCGSEDFRVYTIHTLSLYAHFTEGFTYRHTAKPPTTTFAAKYDILTELGQGSYGIVKKAVCRSSGEYVAVKILKDTRTIRDQNSHPRNHNFRREIEVLQKLKHENICELKEAFWDDSDDIHLILELGEGGDLMAYLLQHSPLSEVGSKHLTYQICDALAYIHLQNVAHRDLKPENILLTKGNPPIIKVADFGLAKFVDSQTMFKTLCGSPAYLAPEIVRQENSEGYDNLVDSWSVGVIVFMMLSRKNPFIENEQKDLRTRILERTIGWEPLLNRTTSPEGYTTSEAFDFVYSLLQEDPRQRMAIANALKHPWFDDYIPVYDRYKPVCDRNTNSSSDISFSDPSVNPSVAPDDAYPGRNVNLHNGLPAVSNSSILPVSNAATDDTNLIPEVLNEREHAVPAPLPGDAYTDSEPVNNSSSSSTEYPPGLLKARTKQIVAGGVENEGVDVTTGANVDHLALTADEH